MSSQTEPRSYFFRILDAFLQEENIKWVLGLGVCILLGSSLRLVTMHWNECTPVWKYLILLSYTGCVFVLGRFSYHRVGLRKTGTVLMALTVLLIPLSFLALHWVRPAGETTGIDLWRNTGLTALLGVNLVFSVYASRQIFRHFLRQNEPTFLISYLLLCVAGAVVPGLPVAWAPILALALWAVFAAGTVKVNRHVFWLAEEHRLPRIFGFFPIALLGAQFAAVFSLGLAQHLTLPWLGLLCTLIALPILLTADAVARVFEQRTGGIVRPLPWSISGPIVLGTVLCAAGMALALTGWPANPIVVPTAALAAVAMGVVAHRTRQSAFVWGMVFCLFVTYQTSPAFFKELALRIRDQAAAAVHESKLPYAFYGLTYAPLILGFSLAAIRLKQRQVELFAQPLRIVANVLPWVLFAVSFTHPSAVLPVSLVLCPLFALQAYLFRQPLSLVPAAMAFLALPLGAPAFCQRVLLHEISFEAALLLWTVAAGLLLFPGYWIDRWSRTLSIAAKKPFSHGPFSTAWGEKVPKADEGVVIDANEVMTVNLHFIRETNRAPHPNPLPRSGGEGTAEAAFDQPTWVICQIFSLIAVFAAAMAWVVCLGGAVVPFELGVTEFLAIAIGGLCLVHALRWLKPLLGEATLIFGVYALQRFLVPVDASLETQFHVLSFLLLGGWLLSYALARFPRRHIAQAFGSPSLHVSVAGLSLLFGWYVWTWLGLHLGFGHGDWLISVLLLAWGLDASRRIGNSILAAIAWSALFLFASAVASVSLPLTTAQSWWLMIWTVIGLGLFYFRRALIAALRLNEEFSFEVIMHEQPSVRRKLELWLSPLPVMIPIVWFVITVVSLPFLDWPQQYAGLLSLAGIGLAQRDHRRHEHDFPWLWPLVNWHLLAGFVTWGVAAPKLLHQITVSELAEFGLPLAALAAASAWLFEAKFLWHRIRDVETTLIHQSLLFLAAGLLLAGALSWHASRPWTGFELGCVLAVWISLTATLWTRAVDHQHQDLVWLGLWAVLAAWIYFLLTGVCTLADPALPYAAFVLGLTCWSIGRTAATTTRFGIFSLPFQLTGFWLPVMVVPFAIGRQLSGYDVVWAGANSLPMLCAAGFYFWRGLSDRNVGTTILSAAILNLTLMLVWHELRWTDPQLFLVPVGISILAITELMQREIPENFHTELRFIGALTILVSPTFHIVTGSWSHILTLMIAAVAICLVAIGLRIRILLYTSTAFLLADLVAMIARGSINQPNLLWIVGIVMGTLVIGLGAVCENHRETVLARIRGLAATLETWR